MPSAEDQLRAYARRLDDAVAPVRAADVLVAEAVPAMSIRRRRGVLVGVVLLAAAVATGAVVVARDHGTDGPGGVSPGHGTRLVEEAAELRVLRFPEFYLGSVEAAGALGRGEGHDP